MDFETQQQTEQTWEAKAQVLEKLRQTIGRPAKKAIHGDFPRVEKSKDYSKLKSVIATRGINTSRMESGSSQRAPSFGAQGLNFTLNQNGTQGGPGVSPSAVAALLSQTETYLKKT